MEGKAAISGNNLPDAWARHMTFISRLYVNEDKTLREVMEIMKAEHSFVASTKMYKRRLREYNCRKNIRSSKSDAQAYQNLYLSRQRPAQITLSNGQVVATDLLATHMVRKMQNRAPSVIRPPDRYYFREAVYSHVRSYMLGRFYESVNTEEALAEMQETTPYTQKWSRFVQQLSDALDNSERMHLDEVLTLMQQAPQELNMVLKRQPPNIVGNIFMFLVVVTPRRAGLSDKESQMFRNIVKSLLNYGATAVPACHPLSHMLRNLARWDTEDLDNFTENNATKCDKLWDLLSPGSPGRVAILNDCVHLSVSTPWLQINQSSSLTILQSQEDAPIKSTKISNYEWLTQRSGVDSSRSFPNGSGSNRNKPEDIVTWHITSEYTRNSGTFAVGNI